MYTISKVDIGHDIAQAQGGVRGHITRRARQYLEGSYLLRSTSEPCVLCN